MNKETLDVRYQLCPLPVIRTQNRIKTLWPGDILSVVCTDPGALHDIPAWCRINGHKVISATTDENSNEITITMEIGSSD